MSEGWDVIVVGAGPAGSTLSIRLAQSGTRVLLIDRAQFPRDKLCGEFLSPECWPILNSIGVGDAIRNSGYQPIHSIRLRLPGGRFFEVEMPCDPAAPAIGLSRQRLDHLLVRWAVEVGVTVAEDLEVVGVVERSQSIVGVRTRPVSGRAMKNVRRQNLYAKVVVAADGRKSMVVQQSGRTLRHPRSTPADVCAVKRHYCAQVSVDLDECIELHSFPGGYAGTCRVEGGIVNLSTLLPIPILRRARGNIERALRWAFENCRVAELLDEAEPLGDWKTIPDVHLQRSRTRLPGVLYVGDAMGTIDPLGGEGIAMALEGSMLACRFVEQAVSCRTGCDRELQQNYQSAWNRRFNSRIQLCRAFSGVLARPVLLGSMLPSVFGDVWPQTLLPLAFRATRGRSCPISTTTRDALEKTL